MADKENHKKSVKSKKNDNKKTVSMRESAAKSRQKSNTPKRVRRAATVATKPINKTRELITKQRHILPRSGTDSFWHKERSASPKWLSDAWKELRQVSWPSRKETWRLVIAVFVFSALLSLLIALLDNLLEIIFRNIFL